MEVTFDDPEGEVDGELLELEFVVGRFEEFKKGFDWDGTGVICILEIDTGLFCWDIVEVLEIFAANGCTAEGIEHALKDI